MSNDFWQRCVVVADRHSDSDHSVAGVVLALIAAAESNRSERSRPRQAETFFVGGGFVSGRSMSL
jgi:hypothetical protein